MPGWGGGGLVHEPGGLYPKSTCISPALKTGGGGGGAQYSLFSFWFRVFLPCHFFFFFNRRDVGFSIWRNPPTRWGGGGQCGFCVRAPGVSLWLWLLVAVGSWAMYLTWFNLSVTLAKTEWWDFVASLYSPPCLFFLSLPFPCSFPLHSSPTPTPLNLGLTCMWWTFLELYDEHFCRAGGIELSVRPLA